MFRTIGIITVVLIFSVSIELVDKFSGGNVLSSVLQEQILQIMATILALNIATASFLVSTLNKVEIDLRLDLFNSSKIEIKQNLYLMILVFLMELFVLPLQFENALYLDIKNIVEVSFLLVYLLALYEMTGAIFQVDEAIKNVNLEHGAQLTSTSVDLNNKDKLL